MQDMYHEEILDRYRHPKNFGKLQNPDIVHKEANMICGDVIEVHIKLEMKRISDAKFTGSGCAISQASSDILMESIRGKSVDEIKKLGKDFVFKSLGIEVSPARLKCALLPLLAVQIGISKATTSSL